MNETIAADRPRDSAPIRSALRRCYAQLCAGRQDKPGESGPASPNLAGLRRDASLAFVLRVAGAGLAYLLQILLARSIGEHGYGIFAFAWIWVIVLGRAGTFGFGESVVRFLPRYEQHKLPGAARAFLSSSRRIVAAGSILMALLAVAILQVSSAFLTSQYIWPLTLAMLCLPLFAAQELYEGIARAKGWNMLALVPVYVLRPVFILTAFAVFVLAGAAPTAEVAILAVVSALIAANLVQVFLVERRLRRACRKPRAPAAAGCLWFKASLPLFMVHWCEEMLTNSDMLVLGFLVEPDQLAVYFAATKTLILAAFVPFAVGVVIGRRFSMHKADGDMEGLRLTARAAAAWTFWPTVAAVSLILALGYPMLWMFGSAFTQGYPILVVLGAGFVLRAAFGQAEDLLIMLGHQRVSLYTAIAALAANLALNIILIPKFGLVGAAVATSITIVARAGALALLAHRLTGVNTTVGLSRHQKESAAPLPGMNSQTDRNPQCSQI